MATEVRCFALFPPPGGTCAETLAALGLGDEGATGPGLGDTEPGLASGWAQDTLADSGINIYKVHAQSKSTFEFLFWHLL